MDMSHMFSIVCDRWNKRAEWDQRRVKGDKQVYTILCPKCGPPHTKSISSYLDGTNHRRWIRTRQLDTCACVLTGTQDAALIRQAKGYVLGKEETR